MPATDRLYQARFEFPDLLERRRDNRIQCPVYLEGNLVEPSAGTVEVRDASGAVIATPVVTIVGQVATATVTQVSIDGKGLAQGWAIEWLLTLPGETASFQFRNEAALVRNQLYPTVTDVDIYRYHPDLKHLRPSSAPSLQEPIAECWAMIQNKLWEQGNRPNLVASPASFRQVLIWGTMAIVYESMAQGPTGTDNTYQETADRYWARFEKAWATLSFRYDADEDGIPDDDKTRRGTQGTTVLVDSGVQNW